MCAPTPSVRAGALLLGGAVLWGTTGTAQALGPADASPLAVGSVRLVAGGALLVAWAVVARRHRAGDRVDLRRVMPTALIGAAGVAAYQLTFFAAVESAGVALGTAVAIGSAPTVTGLLAWLVWRERPSRRWRTATALATAGVVVLAGPSRVVLSGLLLALAAGASYSVYALASKRLIEAGLPSAAAMAWVFGLGGLSLAPLVVLSDTAWVASPAGLAVVGWLAGATILVAYLLYGAGLAGLPVATAATLSLAEPLTAALLGVLVLRERPGIGGAVGGALIVAGLATLLITPSAAAGRRRPPS